MPLADAIVGQVGGGKTTAANRIISLARESGVPVSGILSPRIMNRGDRVGYEIVDVSTQIRAPWLILDHEAADVGPFRVVAEGAALAKHALNSGLKAGRGILVIDEVGPLELRGGGHAWALESLALCKVEYILLVARRDVSNRLEKRWGITLRCWEPNQWQVLAATFGLPAGHLSDG